ncbi:unnamed protein product [Polarella glacialis]|uniref:Uncharacterized protein n=1 Tax=Polarella glacialis TaxID=89957 RepID=A0A813KKV9_POLGL|nr:unnamed protein product [Polarella glacialis]CAE8701830.1 unnamed protein product [Polarella glacialis]
MHQAADSLVTISSADPGGLEVVELQAMTCPSSSSQLNAIFTPPLTKACCAVASSVLPGVLSGPKLRFQHLSVTGDDDEDDEDDDLLSLQDAATKIDTLYTRKGEVVTRSPRPLSICKKLG